MLNDTEKAAIDYELKHVPLKKAACVEALKIVQKHRRWVSDESVADIAEYLDMTKEEVDSVATFYSRIYRKSVGEHVILLCDGMACWLMGNESILKYISKKLGIALGETTKDNKFTLLPNSCLGKCDKAPCMVIDEVTYENITAEKFDEIINNYEL